MRTSDKQAYPVVTGREVLVMARPEPTKAKEYRECIPVRLNFSSKKKARMFAELLKEGVR